ncbi:hypothetical protein H6F47_07820 [Sphaerospermopsis sp. FACHB-1094]|nr:hypothetical protein [Sphaerospermopsis sp. FACHB-1094]
MLDGVDEMGESSPIQALNKIAQELTNWLGQARVILTCRLNVWDATTNNNILPGFTTFKTQEFTPEDVEKFIRDWFAKANKINHGEKLIAQLREEGKERIRELVTNPLRLSLLCQIFDQDENGELPETKAQFYQLFTRYFYEWKPELVPDLITSYELREKLHQGLGKLALAGINSDVRFRLKRSFAVKAMGDERLFNLACEVGWLNQVDRDAVNDEDVYAFFHPNFQEYFAALVIDDWRYFLNHVADNPDQGVYRVFEAKWKEVILLWSGNKNGGQAYQDQKEEFIKALFDFQDNCDNFYWYQSIILASHIITEYKECSLAEAIVWLISSWAVGDFNEQEQKWQDFPLYIKNFASKALLKTNSSLAVEFLEIFIEYKIGETGKINLRDLECLGLIQPGNYYAVNKVIYLLQNSKNWSIRQEAARILGDIAFGNLEAKNALLEVIHTKTGDLLASIPDFKVDSEPDSITKLRQGLERSKILNNKSELDFRASESLYKIDPGNPEAIKTLINMSCWYISAKWFPRDMQLGFSKKLWEILNLDKIPKKIFDSTKYRKESQEYIWHCAQNMSYPKFYHVWHSSKLSLKNLENQFTDTHSLLTQLQPTTKTYPLPLNLKNLQNETDIIEISQEICNQIYLTAFTAPEEIPTVINAPQLKSKIPQIKKYLKTENLALIINNCEANETIINFCNKLTDVLHIAFITEQPLNPPLRGFPQQQNLLNTIQNWINEIE